MSEQLTPERLAEIDRFAKAARGAVLDTTTINALLDHQDALVAEVRRQGELLEQTKRIHNVLDVQRIAELEAEVERLATAIRDKERLIQIAQDAHVALQDRIGYYRDGLRTAERERAEARARIAELEALLGGEGE